MDVQGKVVIVTGASMGIGAATARAFADAGAKLVLAARSADTLAAVAQSLPIQAEPLIVPTDMTDQAQVKALIDAASARRRRRSHTSQRSSHSRPVRGGCHCSRYWKEGISKAAPLTLAASRIYKLHRLIIYL